MTHHLLNWENVLHRAGHRVTRQREVILDAVCAAHGHTSFDDVYARTRRNDRTVDRSTVYRALRLFVDVGLVVEARLDGEAQYEVRKLQPHHHLVCRSCGAEREVNDAAITALVEQVTAQHQFQLTTDHLVLFGTCERCQGATEPTRLA